MLRHAEHKITNKLVFILITSIAVVGYGMGVAHGVCTGGGFTES